MIAHPFAAPSREEARDIIRRLLPLWDMAVSAGDVTMPLWGWLMMGLGIVFTLLVGGGLMALIFYSNRAGFDETPSWSCPRPQARRCGARVDGKRAS